MRDWRSGPRWDRRTLAELEGWRIRVTCGFCRHISHLNPLHLAPLQPRHFCWSVIAHRLHCSCCGKKQAQLALEQRQINEEKQGETLAE